MSRAHTFKHRFASHADRSGGACRAENLGLESAQDAARRHGIRPWRHFEMFAGLCEHIAKCAPESHHVRTRQGVQSVEFRDPQEWDAIAVEWRRDKHQYDEWM